jgi:predicted DNA-binding protein
VCTRRDSVGNTRVNFRLPEDLVERADVAAEVTRKDRTEIVTEALREYLGEIEDDERFREAVVELYLDDSIDFDTLREFVGRQDAEAVRASKEILDRGTEMADDLADG